MAKYLIKRILFSFFSLAVVVLTVMLLVYNLIDKRVILIKDDLWNKKTGNEQTMYEYSLYQKNGYLTFVEFKTFLGKKYKASVGDDYQKDQGYKDDLASIKDADKYLENDSVKEFIKEYEGKGYNVKYLEPQYYETGSQKGKLKKGFNAYLLAVKEAGPFERLWDYVKNFVWVEKTDFVDDPNLTDEERYIKVEKDRNGLFAVVGSGTKHKYLLYFDSKFPFIHQNWLHLRLGTSSSRYQYADLTEVINNPIGESDINVDDYHNSVYDPTIKGYKTNTIKGMTMLERSFVIGLVATLIAYLIGLPLGILLALKKDKIADKIGNLYIIFIMSVPSLAYIFIFAAIGTRVFGLNYNFQNAKHEASLAFIPYILPTISLALPSIGGLMKWMRRYMIDQMNSDYVKFARAEGLSEGEIYRKHISRNAMIFIVHGIPGSLLTCLTGAIITERVYNVDGVGNLLTHAINDNDNGIIVGCTVFYTFLSILAVLLGDLLLAKFDPRISLSSSKGGGR